MDRQEVAQPQRLSRRTAQVEVDENLQATATPAGLPSLDDEGRHREQPTEPMCALYRHLVALVRAGVTFENGRLVERPDGSGVISKPRDQGGHETGRRVGVHGRTQPCRVGR